MRYTMAREESPRRLRGDTNNRSRREAIIVSWDCAKSISYSSWDRSGRYGWSRILFRWRVIREKGCCPTLFRKLYESNPVAEPTSPSPQSFVNCWPHRRMVFGPTKRELWFTGEIARITAPQHKDMLTLPHFEYDLELKGQSNPPVAEILVCTERCLRGLLTNTYEKPSLPRISSSERSRSP